MRVGYHLTGRRLWQVRVALLLTAAALLAGGIGNGEAHQVWVKAVRICLECIGIG